MRQVNIRKREPTRDEPVEGVAIIIDGKLPPPGERMGTAGAAFADDGRALASALLETLPGGTVDALIAELLIRRASLFRVRFGDV